MLLAALVAAALLVSAAIAEAHHCRSKMCLGPEGSKLKRSYKGCKKLHPGRGQARALCEIRRAARHFGQSYGAMRAVAYCESRYRWWISGAHQGMWQYLWSTWRSLPWWRRSVYHPRWSSLATAYAWRIGRRGEWAC